jgi:hypothetical protein
MSETQNAELLYVSLHIPKTAGFTFRCILDRVFGDSLQYAYNENEPWPHRPQPACIHGHGIMQDRFSGLLGRRPSQRWITFLREPLPSAISSYYHRVRGERDRKPWNPPFEDKGLEHFLTGDEQTACYGHNRYRKWLDRAGKELRDFDFVGITERFDESVFLLFHTFGWKPVPYGRSNVGRYPQVEIPERIEHIFRRLNSVDYDLYHEAQCILTETTRQLGAAFEHGLAEFKRRTSEQETGEQGAPADADKPRR